MGTITAYPDPVHGYVYLELDFSDIPTVSYAAVFRVDVATGVETLVRVHTSELNGFIYLNEGTASLYDTEAPLDRLISYRVQVFLVGSGILNINPFFETNVADWTGTNAALAQSSTQAHQGTFSMRVTPTGGVPASAITSIYPVTYSVGSFTVSAWFFAAAGWATMSQDLVWLDSGGTPISTSSQAFALAAGVWQFDIAVFSPPVGATQVQYRVSQNGAPAAGNVWFTDETKMYAGLPIGAVSNELVLASSGGLWVKDPIRPFNDRRVILKYNGDPSCTPGRALYFGGLADEQYASRTELPVVVNKTNPLAVSRTRGGISSTLSIIARTFVDRDNLKVTLGPGGPLLLQAPSQYGIEDTYMSIADATIARMSTDMRQQWRRFELPFVGVDRPAGLMYGVLGSRWRDMCDVYPTFGAATAAGVSWQQVMRGAAGDPGEGVITGWATWSSVVGQYATWTAVVAAVPTWEDLVEG